MYLSPEQHQSRLPVTILTGFLGSGKTTLLNRLLKDERLAETAVAINEFGEAPLDAHLIEHGAERTIVMANGCLCCNVLGEMEDAVMRIFTRAQAGALPSFRRLIIEPSGLADPAPIAQAILRNPVLSRAFRLEGIIATADAVFAARQIAKHPETVKQIAMADKIIVTKSDIAQGAGLEALLRAHNPVAEICFAEHGRIDPMALLPESFVNPDAPSRGWNNGLVADSAGHVAQTRAISLTRQTPLDWKTFEPWLRKIRLTHAEHLLRIKGILNLAGKPVAIHGVHHVLHAPVELVAWPDADHRSRIVFITRGLAAGVIEDAWADFHPTQAMAA
jgi:G3E family GTPase